MRVVVDGEMKMVWYVNVMLFGGWVEVYIVNDGKVLKCGEVEVEVWNKWRVDSSMMENWVVMDYWEVIE